jgi:hypothetical protein
MSDTMENIAAFFGTPTKQKTKGKKWETEATLL